MMALKLVGVYDTNDRNNSKWQRFTGLSTSHWLVTFPLTGTKINWCEHNRNRTEITEWEYHCFPRNNKRILFQLVDPDFYKTAKHKGNKEHLLDTHKCLKQDVLYWNVHSWSKLVSSSLTSLFSTNMAISEMNSWSKYITLLSATIP